MKNQTKKCRKYSRKLIPKFLSKILIQNKVGVPVIYRKKYFFYKFFPVVIVKDKKIGCFNVGDSRAIYVQKSEQGWNFK